MSELQSIYLEIKEFLEDIYIYLSNSKCSTENSAKDSTTLLVKCEKFLQFFDKIYEGIDGDSKVAKDDSYLDMAGVGKPLKENSHDSSQLYDNCQLNETISIENEGTVLEECPYSNLSAENFHIKDSPKQGYLMLREKRILFDQWRKVYAVLMGRWLLIYNDGVCNTKPSTCICIDTIVGSLKKNDTKFTVCSTTGKRWSMQVANSDDTQDWYQKIQQEFPKDFKGKIKGEGSQRRLPTPPVVERKITEMVTLGHRVSQRSDDIYEEPAPMKVVTETKIKSTVEPEKELDKIPQLPKKQKKYWKRNVQPTKVQYDVPKKLKMSEEYQQNKPKPLEPPLVTAQAVEMKPIATTSLVLDSLPEKSPSKDSHKPEKSSKSKRKSGMNQDGESPVKSWIMNRFSRSTEKVKKVEDTKLVVKSKSTSPPPSEATTTTTAVASKQTAKGGKVNVIINQLEANGHLHLLSKSLKEKRRSYYADSGGDGGQNYEPIVMKNIGNI